MANAGATAGKVHRHGCPQCRNSFADACSNLTNTVLCSKCKIGHGWELLRVNREPKDCCVAHSRPASKEKVQQLSLVQEDFSYGVAVWWCCSECGRQHFFDPSVHCYYS